MADYSELIEGADSVRKGDAFEDEVMFDVLSGKPLYWIETHETERAISKIRTALKRVQPTPHVFRWDAARGLQDEENEQYRPIMVSKLPENELMTLRQYIEQEGEDVAGLSRDDEDEPFAPNELSLGLENFGYSLDNSISDALRVPSTPQQPVAVILCDFDQYVGVPDQERKALLKMRAAEYQRTGSAIFILTNHNEMPEDLRRTAKHTVLELPSVEELLPAVDIVLKNKQKKSSAPLEMNEAQLEVLNGFTREEVAAACRGFTYKEAEDALSVCYAREGKFDPIKIGTLKAKMLSMDGLLEIIEPPGTIEDFVGYKKMIYDLEIMAKNLSEDAKLFRGGGEAKGVTFFGPPGTGKTYLAILMGALFGRIVVIAHFDKCHGSLQGETGRNVRRLLATARALAPVILVFDEGEKLFEGTKSSGQTDGGTQARAVGAVLTFMSQPHPGIFVVMTCNDARKLPPEMMRSGRQDDMWFVDLPNEINRRLVLEYHLKKRANDRNKLDVSRLDLNKVASDAVTDRFSCADMEAIAEKALALAYTICSASWPRRRSLPWARSTRPRSTTTGSGLRSARSPLPRRRSRRARPPRPWITRPGG
jgi:hypothetical protein